MKRFLLLALTFFFVSAEAQQELKESFRPVFTGGLVASQVDGDTYAGYNKLGYFAGIGINRLVGKNVELEFDLTILQKGARKNYAHDSASLNNPNNQFYLLRLNYLEIPFYVRYNFKKPKVNKFKVEAGGAVGYLIKNPPFEESQNGYYNIYGFNKFDYSVLIGLGYKLNDNVLVNLRYEYSVLAIRRYYQSSTGIYHGQFPYNLFNLGMYNNMLSLTISYKLPALPPSPSGQ